MSSRRSIITATTIVVVAIGWYLFRPEKLFTKTVVDEPLAAAGATATAPAVAAAPVVQTTAPAALARGSFHGNAHPTSGTATIYRQADGTRLLRLMDFRTSDGPDVRVYLVAANDVNDDATVSKAGFVELGKLKGNIGNQNYEVPASVDLAKYRAVTIWCHRFNVNFGTAPLAPAATN